MSTIQVIPQQQPQLPQLQQPYVNVYPNTVPGQTDHASSHSNGSFGTVFIVLAAILVISAIACCLGRFCSRRSRQSRHHDPISSSKLSNSRQNDPRDRGREAHNDIEFGPDKGFPTTSRPTPNNGIQLVARDPNKIPNRVKFGEASFVHPEGFGHDHSHPNYPPGP